MPLRILGNVVLDRPISFSDKRLVDGVTTEVSSFRPKLSTGKLLNVVSYFFAVEENDRRINSVSVRGGFSRSVRVSSSFKNKRENSEFLLFFLASRSDSNRLQFILWNSENYNMSRTNWIQQQVPSVAAVKSRGFTALLNRSATGLRYSSTGVQKRMPRDIINPFTITYIPQQWNNSYSSFVNQINTKTWKVQGEAITIRNLSIVQVPALIIEVRISCHYFVKCTIYSRLFRTICSG